VHVIIKAVVTSASKLMISRQPRIQNNASYQNKTRVVFLITVLLEVYKYAKICSLPDVLASTYIGHEDLAAVVMKYLSSGV
jgi:hypothetical protein